MMQCEFCGQLMDGLCLSNARGLAEFNHTKSPVRGSEVLVSRLRSRQKRQKTLSEGPIQVRTVDQIETYMSWKI
jgi:hypothetical protein